MEELPLVSIICTVFNQEAFVNECLDSVAAQGYRDFELIIIENGSKDRSRSLVRPWIEKHPHLSIQAIYHEVPLPYCESFNKGLQLSRGKYIIDLSGDDLIFPFHLEKSVGKLEKNPAAAFCFSDAELFEYGKKPKTFYQRSPQGMLLDRVQEGDLYMQIVAGNPVLSVTMVFDASKLKEAGGYDEALAYEDFDIMIRLSRYHLAVFSDHIGVGKRLHPASFSSKQYLPKLSVMLPSTLKVCQKIKSMNENQEEDRALSIRVLYEAKHALWSANFEVASGFLELAKSLDVKGIEYGFFRNWAKLKLDLSRLYVLLKK
ncbi:glycosyltransferase family 2 protein [Belliella marina]|uniref:Glycosyltransferase family 2 protein n=1 Tax=Belliella marina TaxID=1644146 RepID=A0ABW4VU42_9BACT